MAIQNIDNYINKESKAMLKEVVKFTNEIMRPTGIEIDRHKNPNDFMRNESFLRNVFKAFRKLDLHLLNIPDELGGIVGVDWMTLLLIKERMGFSDVGLALSLIASDIPFTYAANSSDAELNNIAKDYTEDIECNMIGCWKISENDTDHKNLCVKVMEEEGAYILSGEVKKVPNAIIASHALFNIVIEDKGQNKKEGIAFIPLDFPGITREESIDKIGLRSLNQGNIIFREVKIPNIYVEDDPTARDIILNSLIATNNLNIGILYSGLAMAAFEEALKYSKQRIQGGVPIFEHRNIKQKLFKMFTMAESARSYTRRLAIYDTKKPARPSKTHSVATKCFSTQTAVEVSSEAIQIFGGNGLAKEYPIEKFFRDSHAGLVENGENDLLSLRAADDF